MLSPMQVQNFLRHLLGALETNCSEQLRRSLSISVTSCPMDGKHVNFRPILLAKVFRKMPLTVKCNAPSIE